MSESKWRRLMANQQNATLSTGPKTDAGKEVSSRNATKHGLTSRHIVLSSEQAEEYNQMRQMMFDGWAPTNVIERELVEELAHQRWRMLRAQNMETTFFEELIQEEMKADPALTPERAFARLFTEEKHAKRMNLMMRYLREATRAWEKARAELKRVVQRRLLGEMARQEMAERLAADNPLPESPATPNGFVSSNGHDAPQRR